MLDLPLGDPEVRKAQTLQTKTTEQVSLVDRFSKFSSWSQATKAVARLQKIKWDAPATVSEQESAKRAIIQDLQKQTYEKEIKLLNKGSQLPHYNKLHHLDVFIDTDGILKVGGRLHHSSHADSFKHPTVKGFTMNEIRSSGYWIPGMRAIASYIRQCVIQETSRGP